MFEPESRYANVPTARYRDDDGNAHEYKLRRRIPREPSGPVAAATVGFGERVDLVSALVLGQSIFYWHLCDINGDIDPHAIETPGRVLKVTSIRNPRQ